MIGIYCRISREKEEGKDRSIEDQRLLGIELAESMKISYKLYIDRGVSGTIQNIEDRPEFSKMIDDIQDGIIDSIYAYDQSRLERSPQIRFVFKKILRENNISLYTANGLVDLNDDESEMLGDIMSIMNEYYVKITRRKIKSVLKRNAQQGKAHGKIMPFGYKKDKEGYLVIDKEEEPIVKEIYAKSLSGIGSSTIKNWLNDNKVPTRYNKLSGKLKKRNKYTGEITYVNKSDIKWCDKTVQDILRNPIYKGKRRWKGEHFDCPSILEKSYWNKVVENLPKNRHNSGRKVSHKYLLRGLIRCGKCGSNYYGRTRSNKKDHYYMCSSKRKKELNCGNRSINITALESFIWDRFFQDERLISLVEQGLQTNVNNDKINELELLRTSEKEKLAELETRKKFAIRYALNSLLTEKELSSNLKPINQDIYDTAIRIENFDEQLNIYQQGEDNLDILKNDLFSLKLDTPFNDRRDLINKYIKNIKILWWYRGAYSLTLEFNLPFLSKEHILIDDRYRFGIDTNRNYFIGLSKKFQDVELPYAEVGELLKKNKEMLGWVNFYDDEFMSNIKFNR